MKLTIWQRLHEALTGRRRNRLKYVREWRLYANLLRHARKHLGAALMLERDKDDYLFRMTVRFVNAPAKATTPPRAVVNDLTGKRPGKFVRR